MGRAGVVRRWLVGEEGRSWEERQEVVRGRGMEGLLRKSELERGREGDRWDLRKMNAPRITMLRCCGVDLSPRQIIQFRRSMQQYISMHGPYLRLPLSPVLFSKPSCKCLW